MEFMEFQLENSALKSLNRDQWASFWEFSNSVDEDCGNYDENSSWPSLYDSYVEWAKSG